MVSSGESARAHCGQTHGCCSTLTLDSKPVASARCRQTPRKRWQTHARPVEEGTGCYGKKTLPRTQRSILVPKRDSGEALGRLPGSLAERHDAHQHSAASTRYSITWSARSSTNGGIVRP